jgi:hypothetical protein
MTESKSAGVWMLVPYAVAILLFLWLLFGILHLNQGRFIYALDDPYIHLALSENVHTLHYGVNSGEPSSPSSSILWPYLLAPFAPFRIHEYVPIVINFLAMLGAVGLLNRFVRTIGVDTWKNGRLFASGLVSIVVVSLNLVGIAFTGMEHSLQVLCALAVLLGTIELLHECRVAWWFLLAIVIGPLIRYENLPLSVGALVVLLIVRRRVPAMATGLVLFALLGGFSLFLVSRGLQALPSSVVQKGQILTPGSGLLAYAYSALAGAKNAVLHTPSARLLAASAALLFFVPFACFRDQAHGRIVGLFSAFAIVAHIVGGRYGWWGRYEVYILIVAVCSLLYLFRVPLQKFVENTRPVWSLGLVFFVTGLLFLHLIRVELKTPWACNNIYEQQYQMHRFVQEFHDGSVAVNDLGWVAYRNPDYVLDLWGLGFAEAGMRRQEGDLGYVEDLVDRYSVPLLMVYDTEGGLKNWIPDRYPRIATLRLGRKRVVSAESVVTFIATDHGDILGLTRSLAAFGEVVPEGVSLTLIGDEQGKSPS